MGRAHLLHPVQDTGGAVATDVQVRVLEPGTTNPIAETIYADRSSATVLTPQPIMFPNGIIDFYLDFPKVVRLGVSIGGVETMFEDIPVGFPEYQTLSWSISSDATIFTGKHRLYIEQDSVLISARVSADPVPTGASLICDINRNGSTLFPTGKPTLATGTNTVKVSPAGGIALTAGDYLTFDIDQVGSTNPGGNLVVQLTLVKA